MCAPSIHSQAPPNPWKNGNQKKGLKKGNYIKLEYVFLHKTPIWIKLVQQEERVK